MASISKLSVRGVRSFSPDDEEQVISFCFPVTMIVGANGCGKTTVIEALKYAVTGSLPPGNKSGQAFVHDPKSVGTSIVKAAVKLRFTNRTGKTMVVVRSMELQQKKTNMTFKSLDGILRTTDEDGNRQSLSHKCTELDRQIPALLGVTKPVLEYVVFCHQEDSSWPLQEGAILKKRFDDIFDSTRYAKALAAIKDVRKNYQSIAKDYKTDLAGLASHKHAAQGFRQELDHARQALSDIKDELEEYDRNIEEEQTKLDQSLKILDDVARLKDNRLDLEAEIDKENRIIETQRKLLEEDWTKQHTEEELEDMLHAFDKTVDKDIKKREEIENEMRQIEQTISELRKERMNSSALIGKLIGDQENHQQTLNKRFYLIDEMAKKYNIKLDSLSQISQTQDDDETVDPNSRGTEYMNDDGTLTAYSQESSIVTAVTLTAEDIKYFNQITKRKKEELKSKLERYQKQSQKTEDDLTSALGDIMAQLQAIERDRSRNDMEKETAMSELSNINSQLNYSRVRKSDIEEAKRQAERFAKQRDELNNDPRRKEIPRKIRECEDKIDKLKREIEDDNVAIKELRRCVEEQNNIDMLKHQIDQDRENLDEIKKENSFLLQKYAPHEMANILGASDDADLLNHLTNLVEGIRDNYQSTKEDFQSASMDNQSAQKQFAEINALLNHKKRTIESQERQLDELNSDGRGVQRINRIMAALRNFEMKLNIQPINSDMDPQELMIYLTDKIAECSMEEDKPENIVRIVKKLRKLTTKKNIDGVVTELVCPCCQRNMNYEETEVFDRSMKQLVDPENSPLIQLEQERGKQNKIALKNYNTWRQTISASIPDFLDFQRIKKENDTLKKSLLETEDELDAMRSNVDETEERKKELDTKTSELRHLVDVANSLMTEINRISDKNAQIKSRTESLALVAPNSGGKDLRTFESDVSAKVEEKDSQMNKISKLNKEMSKLNSDISRLSNQATTAEQLAKEKEAKFAKEQEASKRKVELQDTLSKCSEVAKKLADQIAPLRQKKNLKSAERDRVRSELKVEERKLSETLNDFLMCVERIHNLTSEIDKFVASNKIQQLKKLQDEESSIMEQEKEQEKMMKQMEPGLKAIEKKLSNQERHKKTIKSNIDILQAMDRVSELDDKLVLMDDEIKSIKGVDAARRSYQMASDNIKKFEAEKNRREGSKDAIRTQQRDLKRKLQTPEYEQIDERHRVKMIKYETTVIAVSDLDKYHNALDQALLKYHGIKIEEINKIIRELWALTYKGEDITNIEIVSGEDNARKMSKSYNYRVVMSKGNTELDMRGRCSAGQRVLASIVIRLALAETFCLNCGFMTLDEPTTNLDYANKRGLAIALAQIIANRSAQQNFQLVIITHDEDFVSMMKNELSTHTGFDMPERYFQVSRQQATDGRYYSKIHAIDWDEL